MGGGVGGGGWNGTIRGTASAQASLAKFLLIKLFLPKVGLAVLCEHHWPAGQSGRPPPHPPDRHVVLRTTVQNDQRSPNAHFGWSMSLNRGQLHEKTSLERERETKERNGVEGKNSAKFCAFQRRGVLRWAVLQRGPRNLEHKPRVWNTPTQRTHKTWEHTHTMRNTPRSLAHTTTITNARTRLAKFGQNTHPKAVTTTTPPPLPHLLLFTPVELDFGHLLFAILTLA